MNTELQGTIDFHKLNAAAKFFMDNPQLGIDLITASVRRAAGQLNIVLTIPQRQQVIFCTLYGGSGTLFIESLEHK